MKTYISIIFCIINLFCYAQTENIKVKKDIYVIHENQAVSPLPIAYIGEKSDGIVSKEYILSHPRVELKLDNNSSNIKYTIISFEVTIIPKDTIHDQPSYAECVNTDGQLHKNILPVISKLKSGDLITIYNIEAKESVKNKIVHIQEPLSITIE